ncbi:MAG: CAP domain-containing protein [Cyanobacteria bacterium P01_F01_bin.116]
MGFRTYFSIVLLGVILTGCGGGGGSGGDNNTTSENATTETVTSGPGQSVENSSCTTELTTIFDQLLAETNRIRRKQGLTNLRLSQKLGQAAQGHAEDMANNNYFAHNSPDGSSTIASRITETDYSFSLAAENLAAGHDSAIEVVTDWFNSPGHKANLLNPDYTDVGFGLFFDDSPGVGPNEANYSSYWAQNFGRPTDSNTDVASHYIPHPPENCNIGTVASADRIVLNGAITADAPTYTDMHTSLPTATKDLVVLANHGHKSTSTPEPTIVLGVISTSLGLLLSRKKAEF